MDDDKEKDGMPIGGTYYTSEELGDAVKGGIAAAIIGAFVVAHVREKRAKSARERRQREQLEEERRHEQLRAQKRERDNAVWRWRQDHICIDCKKEFDKLEAGRCPECYSSNAIYMDDD